MKSQLRCDDSIATPLKIIYENILSSGIYHDIWKSANLTPIHTKGGKQLVNNYPCYQYVVKISRNLFSTNNNNNKIFIYRWFYTIACIYKAYNI